MVTSDRVPPRSNASDILKAVRNGPPRCAVCNHEVVGPTARGELKWCTTCNCFQKIYRGPPRESLCKSCFNCVGESKGNSLCAALMYQMSDGTWRDRYNMDHRGEYRQGGMEKIRHLIKPLPTEARYVCECYEPLIGDETRESIAISDPVRFYNRTRFFE